MPYVREHNILLSLFLGTFALVFSAFINDIFEFIVGCFYSPPSPCMCANMCVLVGRAVNQGVMCYTPANQNSIFIALQNMTTCSCLQILVPLLSFLRNLSKISKTYKETSFECYLFLTWDLAWPLSTWRWFQTGHIGPIPLQSWACWLSVLMLNIFYFCILPTSTCETNNLPGLEASHSSFSVLGLCYREWSCNFWKLLQLLESNIIITFKILYTDSYVVVVVVN